MLIDSHCHLNNEKLYHNIDAVIAAANDKGVKILQTISTSLSEMPLIIEIVEKYQNVYCSVGVHPHDAAKNIHLTQNDILDYTIHNKVISIGETGLDYYYNHSDRKSQLALLEVHIDAALTSNLPLIIHTRDAEEDTINILSSSTNLKGVIHCFSGSKYLARKMLDIGFYISLSGIITFKNADDLREIIRYVPIEKLLIETDAPYLAPIPHRGKTNEPQYVEFVANTIADIKNTSFEAIAEITSTNFFALFNKVNRD